MPSYIAKRFILQGRVQGVGCRAQVQELVEGIGHLSGFVRNLSNGTVEVCVKGPDWRVNDLEGILRSKLEPPVQVDRMLVETLTEIPGTGFIVRRDESFDPN